VHEAFSACDKHKIHTAETKESPVRHTSHMFLPVLAGSSCLQSSAFPVPRMPWLI